MNLLRNKSLARHYVPSQERDKLQRTGKKLSSLIIRQDSRRRFGSLKKFRSSSWTKIKWKKLSWKNSLLFAPEEGILDQGGFEVSHPATELQCTTQESHAWEPRQTKVERCHPCGQSIAPDSATNLSQNSIFPFIGRALSFATWNADGFCTTSGVNTDRKRIKNCTFRNLIHNNDITTLQETHGNKLSWDAEAKQIRKSHRVFTSLNADKEGVGGVAIIIKNIIFDQAIQHKVTDLIDGRVLTVSLTFSDGKLDITSIHNQDLGSLLLKKTVDHCKDLTDKAQRDAGGRSVHLVGGDFNFLEKNELPLRIGIDSTIPDKDNDKTRDEAARRKWGPYLDRALEHHQGEPTRVGHNPSKNGERYYIVKRLDRIYSSWLPWQAIHLSIRTRTDAKVIIAEKKYGSDHVPVSTRISLKQQKPVRQRPIPKWLAKHPIYTRTLNELLANYDPETQNDPFLALQDIKRIMRAASKKAIKLILVNKGNTPQERMQFVLQASRAIAYNISTLARYVKRDYPDLGRFLHIEKDGVVSLNNAIAFNAKTIEIASACNSAEENEINSSETGGRRKKGRETCAGRKMDPSLVPLQPQSGQCRHHQRG